MSNLSKPSSKPKKTAKPLSLSKTGGKRHTNSESNNARHDIGEVFSDMSETVVKHFADFKQLYWSRPRIILCLSLVLIFCLQVTAVVTPHWLQLHDVHYQGIWRVCTQTRYGIKCFRYDAQPKYFKPIQGMMVSSTVCYLISLAYLCYMLKMKKAPGFVLTALLALGGTLSIGSLAWFTDANLQTVTLSAMKFSWSYYIGWVAVILTISSAVISLWDERHRTTAIVT